MNGKIETLLKRMDEETKDGWGFERALYLLLDGYKEKLPEPDDNFHKAFRQWDVTDNSCVDMAIWQSIQQSKVFWRCFESVQDEKPHTTKE